MGKQNTITLSKKAPVFLPSPPPKRKCRKTGKLIQKFGKMGDSTVPIP